MKTFRIDHSPMVSIHLKKKHNRDSFPHSAVQGVILPSFNSGESEATISSLFLAI